MNRRIPRYRRFKPRHLGLVVIDGTQHYLGKYGSPESIAEYDRLIQEWLARGPSLPCGNQAVRLRIERLTSINGHLFHYQVNRQSQR